MKFIEKLDFNIDLNQAQKDLETILSIQPWPERTVIDEVTYPANQLGLTYRPESVNPWIDASGSLIDPKTGIIFGKESDFTEFNSSVPKYTKSILSQLAEQQNTKFGRIRYMRLMPKTGLTIHHDLEKRYHLVLQTNPFALFGEYIGGDIAANCYHVPADGHFYYVDTTRKHFVYNGSWEPRIHLVICEV